MISSILSISYISSSSYIPARYNQYRISSRTISSILSTINSGTLVIKLLVIKLSKRREP